MLFQPSNIAPSTFASEGKSCVDANDNIFVMWQLNGNSQITSYRIVFYQNTSASKVVFDTEKINAPPNTYPTNEKGVPNYMFYSVDESWADHGFVNGQSYKYKITQYWSDNNVEYEVTQYSESVFYCFATGTLAIADSSGVPITNNYAVTNTVETFLGTYTQAQNLAVSTSRWILTDITNDIVLKDTGIVTTANLKFRYEAYEVGITYSLSLTVVDQYGRTVNKTINFSVNYEVSSSTDIEITCNASAGYIQIELPTNTDENIKTNIFRSDTEGGLFKPYYNAGNYISAIRDYGVKPYGVYSYKALTPPAGQRNDYQMHFQQNNICLRFDSYYLYEATDYCGVCPEYDEAYHVIRSWRFGNNISAGNVSNNNSPSFLENFTGYPLKQPVTNRQRSGVLQALLSNFKSGEYNDTAEEMDALYDLSYSLNTLFIKDMKGNLYMVAVSAPIVQTINTQSGKQEVTISVPWQEIGDASDVALISIPDDEGWEA